MNTLPPLDYLEAPPLGGQKPQLLLVLLHGLGADKHDLMTLAEPLQMFIQTPTRVVSPDAPFPCDLAPVGKQWFSMKDHRPEQLVEGVRHAAPYLRQFLVQQATLSSLSIRNTIILGFSQGGMMALHVALRLESNPLGIICLSGGLIEDNRLAGELSASPPILMCHGKNDSVVPISVAEETLNILKPTGINISLEKFDNLEHTIDDRVLAKVGSFLNAHTLKP